MATTHPFANTRILVVDDEPDLRTLYELTLLREGYQVEAAESVHDAWAALDTKAFDLVITDMRLPDGTGTEILKGLRAQQRNERCVVITAYGSAQNAVECLKEGAFDYLTKPVDLKQFRGVVAAALQGATGSGTAFSSSQSAPLEPTFDRGEKGDQALSRMAGDSLAMRTVRERIVKVARSMAPVMIRGESGTGKELVAQALHANSHRRDGPWVAVNCGAIPENLLEAEFFGAKKGPIPAPPTTAWDSSRQHTAARCFRRNRGPASGHASQTAARHTGAAHSPVGRQPGRNSGRPYRQCNPQRPSV